MVVLCYDMLVLPVLAAGLVLVPKVWAQKELVLELVEALPLLLSVLWQESLAVEWPF